MAHGDDEVRADEEEDLAERHGLLAVDVARRLDHDEQRVVVDLELRALVRLERVLDGELVELERGPHLRELLFRRLVEAQPHERPGPFEASNACSNVNVPGRRTPAS